MSNYIKYYIHSALYSVILLFISGGIVQTFFAAIGFSARQIGIYTAAISVIQTLVTVLNVFVADNVKKPKESMTWLSLSPVLQCLPMMFFCFLEPENVTVVFYMVLFFCCVCNFFMGIRGILIFRLPYLIIDMKDYAKFLNTSGIIEGIVSVLASGLIATLLLVFPMRSVMLCGYLASVLFSIIASCMIRSMKVKNAYSEETKKTVFSWKILIRREFAYFYLPNFLRGICMGVISILPVVCRREITQDDSVLSGLATVMSVAMIVGCMLYQAIREKVKTNRVYLLWSVVQFVFLLFILSGKSIPVFCICYLIVYIGYCITNMAVPVFVTEIILYKDIGTYTSVRLIVMTIGTAVSSYGTTVLMDYVPAAVILAVAGGLQLISGLFYYFYENTGKNE